MPYKDILVFLDAGYDNAAQVDTALRLAVRHGSRLIGVDVSTPAAFEPPYRDRALGLRDDFEARALSAGIDGEYRLAAPSASTANDVHAHCADLIVATQPHSDRKRLSPEVVPREILLTAGVPMLVLPTGWRADQDVGRQIMLAWNFSRESTRAMHDAMPMLVRAERVVLFVFDEGLDPEHPAIHSVRGHLERHGARVELDGWRSTGETDPVIAMFADLDRHGKDLIVAGAYGRSPPSDPCSAEPRRHSCTTARPRSYCPTETKSGLGRRRLAGGCGRSPSGGDARAAGERLSPAEEDGRGRAGADQDRDRLRHAADHAAKSTRDGAGCSTRSMTADAWSRCARSTDTRPTWASLTPIVSIPRRAKATSSGDNP